MSDEAPAQAPPSAEAEAPAESEAVDVEPQAAAPADAAQEVPAEIGDAEGGGAEECADAALTPADAEGGDAECSQEAAAAMPMPEAAEVAAPADTAAEEPAESGDGVTADPKLTEEDLADRKRAAQKIQAIQRGRQTRKVLNENDLEGARSIFAERHMMRDQHMEAKMLARSAAGNQMEEEQAARMDNSISQKAHDIAAKHEQEEAMAAVRMQSLYRGFRDRKQVRCTREDAEELQRQKIAGEQRLKAEQASQKLEMQTAFTAGGIEKSYLTSTRKDHSRRSPGQSTGAPKAVLTPTLVDKKANMTAVQKKACIVLEENIKKWATSYARAVELAPGSEKTGALEFVALFSKPSKEEPIAWPVVRVYLTMKNDFEAQLVPQVTYHLEGEKMKFDTSSDLGRRFKEAWLDRIVMDKRAIRADMALRHKK